MNKFQACGKMERAEGVEPSSSVWKTIALTVELRPHEEVGFADMRFTVILPPRQRRGGAVETVKVIGDVCVPADDVMVTLALVEAFFAHP